MKIEKLPSGSYRIRKQIDGKRVSLVFDHKPTQAEILATLGQQDFSAEKGTFYACARSYIESKSNILSPKTYKEYYNLLNSSLSKEFSRMKMSQITQKDIQLVINQYAADHAPKTVRNLHGFISAVLKQFKPNMSIHTTLPKKRPYEPNIPTYEDVKAILDASENDARYHIPFQLGLLGLRRSEVCALDLSDIDGNTLTINKALVLNKENKWVIKETKTEAGARKVFIPDALVEEIKEKGSIFDGHPGTILEALHRYQDQLNIKRFRLHDMRHFYATFAHSKGMSDANIMASGGWRSTYVMTQIYRHEMNVENEQKRIAGSLLP